VVRVRRHRVLVTDLDHGQAGFEAANGQHIVAGAGLGGARLRAPRLRDRDTATGQRQKTMAMGGGGDGDGEGYGQDGGRVGRGWVGCETAS
jgi:hypothetical protein